METLELVALHCALSSALYQASMYHEALAHADTALAHFPRDVDSNCNRGKALLALGRASEAIASFKAVINEAPFHFAAHNNLGASYYAVGAFEKAEESFLAALRIDSRVATVHWNLANLRPFTKSDQRLVKLNMLLSCEPSLLDEQRIALHYALGKAYGDLKDFTTSFEHYLKGATLKRTHNGYDEQHTLSQFRRIKTFFDADRISKAKLDTSSSRSMVFVVGMPRSGTTLVEQIIASHSKAWGAGELSRIGQLVSSLGGDSRNSLDYPEIIEAASAEMLLKCRNTYLMDVAAVAPSVDHVVDKTPANYLYLGLIKILLPEARVIHVQRDPADTCLSCFVSLFSDNHQSFSYDLGELGRYYAAYRDLMIHWAQVLPPRSFLTVHYEELIEDFEQQAKQIIDHCGLQWEPQCLTFHLTDRVVQTASALQVRQPLFKSSVGRSNNYREFLAPLLREITHTS